MRRDQVPQDGNRTLAGNRKAIYAVDEDGRLRATPSEGWSVEELVTSLAVEEFRELAADALEQARAGRVSPLAYHMYAQRMDPQVLAQSTGLFQWRVRRHLKPGPFSRLSARQLRRYAEALGIDLDTLRSLPEA